MKSLSPSEYLELRSVLAEAWQTDQTIALSHLNPDQQWQLHNYFHFDEEVPTTQILSHLLTVQACKPEIETRGLASLSLLEVIADGLRAQSNRIDPVKPGAHRGKDYKIRVYALVRPEPDSESLAKAFLALARQMRDEELAKGQKP